ncbi:SgcJ/EcaC family oxidoreductase [Amycolatopsis sp. NPDC059021]|uniref:SgcJ/EcaC family oxidoreductase n=1 Tax=Amycolatopsis sp. NPDC059021 TaxID=3346704 RepID=UPI00366B9C90
MPGKASELVAGAKKWAANYGDFPNGEEGAVLTVPLRIRGAWERNDAELFAEVFADNGSMLVGDKQLKSREEVLEYMKEAFAGDYAGARLEETPVVIRKLSDTVAFAVTKGGVVLKGETGVAPEREVRATWVIVKEDGDWKLLSHQTSPITG